MSRPLHTLAGITLIAVTIIVFGNAAMSVIIRRPDGLGLWFVIGTLWSGGAAVRSIWRDRF